MNKNESTNYIEESQDKSKLDKRYIPKEKYRLSSFKKIPMGNSSTFKQYISKDKKLEYYTRDYGKGYLWVDNKNDDALVALVLVSHDGSIAPIHIYPKYRGHSLSKQIMKIAINELHAEYLYVEPDNEVAIKLYKDLGFEIMERYNSKYYMCLKGSGAYKEELERLKTLKNESPIEESQDEVDRFNRIIKMNDTLNLFEYGYIYDNKKCYDFDNLYPKYKTISIKDFEKYKIGVCWDYTRYQKQYLNKFYKNVQNYYFEMDNEERASHTITIIKVGDIYIYPESSSKAFKGIYQSDDIDKIISIVIDSMHTQDWVKNKKYNVKVYKYTDPGSGLDIMEFMDEVTKNGTLVKYRYKQNSKIDIISESPIEESSKKDVIDIAIKAFKELGCDKANMDEATKKKFNEEAYYGYHACITGLGTEGLESKCAKVNKIIKPMGYKVQADNYGTAFIMAIKNRANAIKESKENRSELPDNIFGLPELRKYPMPDKKHILSAIKFFNYVSPENEKELAKNIKKKMKQYDISPDHIGDKNRLKKYL